MESEFRDKVLGVAEKGLQIMEDYFEGKTNGSDMIKQASRMISEGVKVSNRNQVDSQVKRSQALRLIQYMPPEVRSEYIVSTSPETKPFLLARPDKKKLEAPKEVQA